MVNMEEDAGESAARVGERLAAARQAQGLTLDDIVQRTRIPRRHLEMIEAGNHSALPAIPYSAGFVKTYGQTLGLDGAELSRDFRSEVAQMEQVRHVPEPFSPADPARMPSRMLAFVALGVAVLLALAYMVWRGGRLDPDERTSLAAGTSASSAPTAQPAPATPQLPPTAVAPAPAIAITANQPVWVRIYERGGATLFQGEMAVGQRFEMPPNAVDPLIRTGRPQALQVSVGTAAIPPLGPADRTISDVSLRREALLARLAPPPVAPPPVNPATPPARRP